MKLRTWALAALAFAGGAIGLSAASADAELTPTAAAANTRAASPQVRNFMEPSIPGPTAAAELRLKG